MEAILILPCYFSDLVSNNPHPTPILPLEIVFPRKVGSKTSQGADFWPAP